MYVLKMIVLAILIFLIFGTWLPIIGLPGWIALPFQARERKHYLLIDSGKILKNIAGIRVDFSRNFTSLLKEILSKIVLKFKIFLET